MKFINLKVKVQISFLFTLSVFLLWGNTQHAHAGFQTNDDTPRGGPSVIEQFQQQEDDRRQTEFQQELETEDEKENFLFSQQEELEKEQAAENASVQKQLQNIGGAPNADRSYQLLAPIEGTQVPISNEGLTAYLQLIFKYAIGFAGIITVLSMVYAGIEYIGSGASLTSQADAKNRMKAAFIGLALALTSYVILNTINPELVNFELKLPPIQIAGNTGVESGPEKIVRLGKDVGNAAINALTSRSTDNRLGKTDCTDCVKLDRTTFTIKNNDQVAPELASKLLKLNDSLKQAGVNWRITEAWPPTSKHVSTCHYNGTCIDANLSSHVSTEDGSVQSFDTKGIVTFIRNAESAGLRPVFEVKTNSDAEIVLGSSDLSKQEKETISSHLKVIPKITAPHFSVYNQ